MGIATQLRATGRWSSALQQAPQFSTQLDIHPAIDELVCLRLFSAGFTSASADLADVLGVPLRSGTHPIVGDDVSIDGLERWCRSLVQSGARGTAEQFAALRDAGFTFVFFVE